MENSNLPLERKATLDGGASKKRVRQRYRAAFCERDAGGYNVMFKRKHIRYIICAGSRTEAAAWRKAERAIYGT